MGNCQIIILLSGKNEEDHLNSQLNVTSLYLSADWMIWMNLMIKFSFLIRYIAALDIPQICAKVNKSHQKIIFFSQTIKYFDDDKKWRIHFWPHVTPPTDEWWESFHPTEYLRIFSKSSGMLALGCWSHKSVPQARPGRSTKQSRDDTRSTEPQTEPGETGEMGWDASSGWMLIHGEDVRDPETSFLLRAILNSSSRSSRGYLCLGRVRPGPGSGPPECSVADREAEERHREQPRECIFSKLRLWPLIGARAKITWDCAPIGRDEPGQHTTTSPHSGHVTWPPPCWIGSLPSCADEWNSVVRFFEKSGENWKK